jgi:peptidyl-prolyl cis-trans isomerase SurA
MFGDAIDRLQVGDVTEPVRSASGFHLVKLIDKRGSERQMVRQTRARHILIALDELTDDAAARRQLSALHERIVNGQDFGELARIHSDDTGSAPKGGELGWIDPGNTIPVFERMMDSLEPDGLSEPFRTQFGWHIVQVLERRERDGTETSRRAEAARRLRARKIEENMQAWVRRVRGEAYVEYRLDE